MTTPFGPESITDDVLQGVDLSGKRILVAGASAGLGVETARALAAHGAKVVGAARNLDKARIATEIAREAANASGGSLQLIELDLASLTSVRASADALLADGRSFDVIIANAGVMTTPKGQTADDFETQFGTNHLGHFVLVNRIASPLMPGGLNFCTRMDILPDCEMIAIQEINAAFERMERADVRYRFVIDMASLGAA